MSEQPTLPFDEEDTIIDPLAGEGLFVDNVEVLEVPDGDA
jgi:hypothetical protein